MSEALLIGFTLLGWIAIITAGAVVFRLVRGRPTPEEVEMDELRARYARREVPYAEYDRRRRQLGDQSDISRGRRS
jgi:hypothetical protein